MEFERALFRIYDRFMQLVNLEAVCKLIVIGSFCMSAVSLIVTMSLDSLYLGNGEVLAKVISEQVLEGYTFYNSSEFKLQLPIKGDTYPSNNSLLLPEDIYSLKIGPLAYEFSVHHQSVTLPKKVSSRRGFTTHNITISREDLISGVLWPLCILYDEVDTVVLNQFLTVFGDYKGMLRNKGSEEIWIWSEGEPRLELGFFEKLLNLFSAVGVFALLSWVTGLLCRVAIAGSAAFMVGLSVVLRACNVGENTILVLFYSFPWIGQPAYALRNSGRGIGRLLMAFFITLLVFYFLYGAAYVLWTSMIFGHIYPKGLNEKFYTIFSVFEFFSLIFVRTKNSVLYFPKGLLVLVCGFLMFCFNNFYAFMNAAFATMAFGSIGLMGLTVLKWEKPCYSQNGLSYNSPRLVYQPIFNRNSTALPEIWTLFYTPEARGFFSEEEMTNIFPQPDRQV